MVRRRRGHRRRRPPRRRAATGCSSPRDDALVRERADGDRRASSRDEGPFARLPSAPSRDARRRPGRGARRLHASRPAFWGLLFVPGMRRAPAPAPPARAAVVGAARAASTRGPPTVLGLLCSISVVGRLPRHGHHPDGDLRRRRVRRRHRPRSPALLAVGAGVVLIALVLAALADRLGRRRLVTVAAAGRLRRRRDRRAGAEPRSASASARPSPGASPAPCSLLIADRLGRGDAGRQPGLRVSACSSMTPGARRRHVPVVPPARRPRRRRSAWRRPLRRAAALPAARRAPCCRHLPGDAGGSTRPHVEAPDRRPRPALLAARRRPAVPARRLRHARPASSATSSSATSGASAAPQSRSSPSLTVTPGGHRHRRRRPPGRRPRPAGRRRHRHRRRHDPRRCVAVRRRRAGRCGRGRSSDRSSPRLAVPALGVYRPELFPTSLRGRAGGVVEVFALAGAVDRAAGRRRLVDGGWTYGAAFAPSRRRRCSSPCSSSSPSPRPPTGPSRTSTPRTAARCARARIADRASPSLPPRRSPPSLAAGCGDDDRSDTADGTRPTTPTRRRPPARRPARDAHRGQRRRPAGRPSASLAPLDLVITRGGVTECVTATTSPSTSSRRRAPTTARRYLERMLPSFTAHPAALFDAYPELDSFDVCQEPVPDGDAAARPVPGRRRSCCSARGHDPSTTGTTPTSPTCSPPPTPTSAAT